MRSTSQSSPSSENGRSVRILNEDEDTPYGHDDDYCAYTGGKSRENDSAWRPARNEKHLKLPSITDDDDHSGYALSGVAA